ncbi:IclR family transcriptional regulator [Brucellaceae bacterium D45D]
MRHNDETGSNVGSVPALRRAVLILDLVANSQGRLTAADITKAIRLPKSTAHGLLTAMVELDLLNRASDGIFRLGAHPMRWTNSFLSRLDVVSVFQEHFAGNPDLANYTVTLTVREGNEVVYVGCRNSNQPLGFTFRIGMRLPAAFTATGKMLLSSLAENDVRALFAEDFPAPLTKCSVADMSAMLKELKETRKRGFSIDDGQIREGMICVGAALRDHSGRAIAGIAVSLIKSEASQDVIHQLGENLRSAADLMSIKLGDTQKSL